MDVAQIRAEAFLAELEEIRKFKTAGVLDAGARYIGDGLAGLSRAFGVGAEKGAKGVAQRVLGVKSGEKGFGDYITRHWKAGKAGTGKFVTDMAGKPIAHGGFTGAAANLARSPLGKTVAVASAPVVAYKAGQR